MDYLTSKLIMPITPENLLSVKLVNGSIDNKIIKLLTHKKPSITPMMPNHRLIFEPQDRAEDSTSNQGTITPIIPEELKTIIFTFPNAKQQDRMALQIQL